MVSAYVGFFASEAYDVCWPCSMARMRSVSSYWRSFRPFRSKPVKPQWIKHTPFHWQMTIDGNILDFWPGKRSKYRWKGQTYLGPPNIKAMLGE